MKNKDQLHEFTKSISFNSANAFIQLNGHPKAKNKLEAETNLRKILYENKESVLFCLKFLNIRGELGNYIKRDELKDLLDREDFIKKICYLIMRNEIGIGNLELEEDITELELLRNPNEHLENYADSYLVECLQEVGGLDDLDSELYLKATYKKLGLEFSNTNQDSSDKAIIPSVSPNYNPDLLNLTSGAHKNISFQKLIDRIRKVWAYLSSSDPSKEFNNYNLFFEGGPGLGKTATAHKIASDLGIPFYSISFGSISSGYHGETESNINGFFAEASIKPGIVFIDEGDSLLHSREKSDSTWNTTVVNETLVQIEKYPGIVIVSTNMNKKIDKAALRRFSERITFLPLTRDQKAKAFKTYFKTDLTSGEVSILNKIPELNLGDFLCVRKRTFFENLPNMELIQHLSDEVVYRNQLDEENDGE